MQALLELNCMPAGMELFPAANDDQWNWIKKVIDESDYYIVIIAGRYGSTSKITGLSYTEMEFRYAIEKRKPVIAFIHENPSSLPAKHYESNQEGRDKLNKFQEFVQSRLCKYWTTPADLGAKVSRSLTQLIKQYPSAGWIKADMMPEESAVEILTLRRRVEELELELQKIGTSLPVGTESLSNGTDLFELVFAFDRKRAKEGRNSAIYWVNAGEDSARIELSWDEIFASIAPAFIEPVREHAFGYELNRLIEARATPLLEEKFPGERFTNFHIYENSYKTVKVQLRALRLLSTVPGDKDQWVLTAYGDTHMNDLLAVKKAALRTKLQKNAARVRKQRI